jgi:hypothetical protein
VPKGNEPLMSKPFDLFVMIVPGMEGSCGSGVPRTAVGGEFDAGSVTPASHGFQSLTQGSPGAKDLPGTVQGSSPVQRPPESQSWYIGYAASQNSARISGQYGSLGLRYGVTSN